MFLLKHWHGWCWSKNIKQPCFIDKRFDFSHKTADIDKFEESAEHEVTSEPCQTCKRNVL